MIFDDICEKRICLNTRLLLLDSRKVHTHPAQQQQRVLRLFVKHITVQTLNMAYSKGGKEPEYYNSAVLALFTFPALGGLLFGYDIVLNCYYLLHIF